MALQTVAPFIFPHWALGEAHFQTIANFATSILLDSTTTKIGFIFRVPKSGDLKTVGFLTGAVTTAQTLKVSFQDVSATDGNPDGTVDQFHTHGTGDTGALSAWTWQKTGIIDSDGSGTGTKRTVTRGDLLAIVFEWNSTQGSLNIITQGVAGSRGLQGNFYYNTFASGAWAAKPFAATALPHFALEYSDGSFAPILQTIPCKGTGSAASFTTQGFASGNASTPDEVALKFQVPFSCKFGGFVVEGDFDGPMDLVLYDSGSTALVTVSTDPDQRFKNGNCGYYVPATEQTLTINATYRVAVKPTDGTASSAAVAYFDVDAAAILDQMSGGQNALWSQRTDAGSWTDTTTRRPMIGILVTALDDGAGGGASETFTGTLINRGLNF